MSAASQLSVFVDCVSATLASVNPPAGYPEPPDASLASTSLRKLWVSCDGVYELVTSMSLNVPVSMSTAAEPLKVVKTVDVYHFGVAIGLRLPRFGLPSFG
jgi:hypothetical protein